MATIKIKRYNLSVLTDGTSVTISNDLIHNIVTTFVDGTQLVVIYYI